MLLDTHITLPSGDRVRLRLPQGRETRGVGALLLRLGLNPDDVDVRRLLRFDPRRRAVVCATLWTAEGEVLVGVGGLTYLDGHVDLLVTDEELAPGLAEALHGVLTAAPSIRRAA